MEYTVNVMEDCVLADQSCFIPIVLVVISELVKRPVRDVIYRSAVLITIPRQTFSSGRRTNEVQIQKTIGGANRERLLGAWLCVSNHGIFPHAFNRKDTVLLVYSVSNYGIIVRKSLTKRSVDC
jgi:hypothetical protein